MLQFVLFMRGGYELYARYTPEEIQQSIQKYRDWAQMLRDQGKLVAAEKMKDGDRRILRLQNNDIAVDGPLPDTEETLGGYFIVEVANQAEVLEIAKSCPIFADGGTIELREIEQS
jgi:hypothetical protein